MILALLLAIATPEAREQRFLELLRTYPERPPAETFRQVAQLVEEGPFAQRDRAEYWIGSARLAAGDRAGARQWFDRVAHDYPQSVWEERSWLLQADAAVQERRFSEALAWCARGRGARDAAVREIAGITASRVRVLQRREHSAWIAGAVALAIAAFFAIGARGAALLPLPAEARVVLPVLGVLAVLSTRVDPAPRGAVLAICAAGALLTLLGGWRLRARSPGIGGRLVHASLALVALGCVAWVAVVRADLVGMVAETVRVGPE